MVRMCLLSIQGQLPGGRALIPQLPSPPTEKQGILILVVQVMGPTQFSDLPTELRFRIWRLSLRPGAVAVFHGHATQSSATATNSRGAIDAGDDDRMLDSASRNAIATTRFETLRAPPLPPVTRVNREARHEILPLYPWLAVSLEGGSLPAPSARSRFNTEMEQLLLAGRCGVCGDALSNEATYEYEYNEGD